jgi:hypothetical protein
MGELWARFRVLQCKENKVFNFKVLAVVLVLFATLSMVPSANAGVGIYITPPVIAVTPPVCEFGYYDYEPYSCAPYGYYPPDFFYGGVFIGVGPWWGWGYNHGWGGHPFYGNYRGHGYEGHNEYRGYHHGGVGHPSHGGHPGVGHPGHQGGGGHQSGGQHHNNR